MTIKIEGQEVVSVDGRGRRVCRPLLSAFVCPKCREVLRAYFETDRPVDIGEQSRNPYDLRERVRSVVVPGGQGLISGTHRQYGGVCDLEIYWAMSLKHNLQAWLARHYADSQLGSFAQPMTAVKAGQVPGLVAIQDIVGSDACLLGFDQNAWCPRWDHRRKSYDE